MSMNNIVLQGRLVEDPKFYDTKGGKLVKFPIAVYRAGDRVDGKAYDGFFNVEAWEDQAEFAERNFSKGKMIYLIGELRHHKWTDKETQIKKSDVRIHADKFGFPNPPAKKAEETTEEYDPNE